MSSSTSYSGISSYYTLLNNEIMDGEILRSETGFTFIDFLPRVLKSGGIFTSSTYENYRSVVDRANYFLQSNKKWRVITCESTEFKASTNDKIDHYKMTYLEYGKTYTSYIRGLRLWLTERKDGNEREQQIGYFNLIPQKLEKGGIFSPAKFETLDNVIERFNSMLQTNPLPGRIFTIESQEMYFTNFEKIDPDRSNWSERGEIAYKTFIFVLRIFYDIKAGSSEEIGVKDFIPDTISEEGIFSLPEYERFSNIMKEASAWLAQQQGFRFCNAQTLEIKAKRGKEVNTQRMDYSENSPITYYARILRIAYTKPLASPYSISEKRKPSPITELTCRSFIPIQLTTSALFVPEYENLVVTKERITAWVKATGAHVLSAETATYRIMTGGERKQGSEATFSYKNREKNVYWMYVIRLYLDGVYKEPPPEMLPPVPALESNSCCIS